MGEGNCLGRGTRETFGEMGMFYILTVVTWVYTFVETHGNVHFKWICFIACKLYLKKLTLKKIHGASTSRQDE